MSHFFNMHYYAHGLNNTDMHSLPVFDFIPGIECGTVPKFASLINMHETIKFSELLLPSLLPWHDIHQSGAISNGIVSILGVLELCTGFKGREMSLKKVFWRQVSLALREFFKLQER